MLLFFIQFQCVCIPISALTLVGHCAFFSDRKVTDSPTPKSEGAHSPMKATYSSSQDSPAKKDRWFWGREWGGLGILESPVSLTGF